MGKPTKKQLEQAQTLIRNWGEPVLYRGERWYYLRTTTPWVRRAVSLLESAGRLKRWSEKTPNVVAFLGGVQNLERREGCSNNGEKSGTGIF